MDPTLGPRSTQTTEDKVEAILREAVTDLRDAEARLADLAERAAAVIARTERERTELKRFLDEFGIDPSLDDASVAPALGNALIDVEAIRRGATELANELEQSSALRGNLTTAAQVVRSCREQLSGDRALQPLNEAADARLHHAMNAAREDERSRLSREIHDGPAQVLANAIFAIEIAEQVARRAPEQVSDELRRLRGLLRDGVAEIRRFMFDLRPTMLQDQGLAPTLKRYVEDYSRFFAKRVSLQVMEPLPPMTSEQELTIFRIVQEALQNIHKHASVDEAEIELTHEGNRLRLRIADQGKGFHPGALASKPAGGAGLYGMRERAKLIGADLSVESYPGAGTEIIVTTTLRATTGPLGAASTTVGGQGGSR